MRMNAKSSCARRESTLARNYSVRSTGRHSTTMDPLTESLSRLADVLERLRIPYLIGGSVASGARGVARLTLDVDLLAHILTAQAGRLSDALGSDWHADADHIRESIRRERSFNVIYIPRA